MKNTNKTNKTINVKWSEEDNIYIANYIDNTLIKGYGNTMLEAVKELEKIQEVLEEELSKMISYKMGDKK
jgi:threonine dehydratase